MAIGERMKHGQQDSPYNAPPLPPHKKESYRPNVGFSGTLSVRAATCRQPAKSSLRQSWVAVKQLQLYV